LGEADRAHVSERLRDEALGRTPSAGKSEEVEVIAVLA
jgi:hypothetical protein